METRLVHPPPGEYKKAADPSGGTGEEEAFVADPFMSVSPPIYQAATFGQPGATTGGPYDYSRSGNPTRSVLERQMADIEGGVAALAFASGMASITTAVRALVMPGEGVIAGRDIYGGTQRFLGTIAGAGCEGRVVDHVNMASVDEVEAALEAFKAKGTQVKLVIVETPTNPKLEVCDIQAIADVSHAHGALVMVDNSMMAPLLQKPLSLGADIAMTSATKFIAGHSDVTGGILSVSHGNDAAASKLKYYQNAEGNMMSPFESWLCLRGLKTMALRMERQATNASTIAEYLASHALVKRVNYPGLESHPGSQTHARQATGGGCIISFETGDVEVSRRIVEDTQLFKITVSFGSVSSLISLPCYMSHASVPAEIRKERGLVDDLVRISVGIEDVDDLLADLDQAFKNAAFAVGKASLCGYVASEQ